MHKHVQFRIFPGQVTATVSTEGQKNEHNTHKHTTQASMYYGHFRLGCHNLNNTGQVATLPPVFWGRILAIVGNPYFRETTAHIKTDQWAYTEYINNVFF